MFLLNEKIGQLSRDVKTRTVIGELMRDSIRPFETFFVYVVYKSFVRRR